MPKPIDNPWTKGGLGFQRDADVFSVSVGKLSYRNWIVRWRATDGDWKFYIGDIETAAIAKSHADKLLARLTAAIAVKETQCT